MKKFINSQLVNLETYIHDPIKKLPLETSSNLKRK